MTFKTVQTLPIRGRKPDRFGLSKKKSVFHQPRYLGYFVQCIFDGTGGAAGKTYVVGGDGRFFSAEAIGIIIGIAAGNRAARLIVGQNGILSNNTASNLIRKYKADGGITLFARNQLEDDEIVFGILFSTDNGEPASSEINFKIFVKSLIVTEYLISEDKVECIDEIGSFDLAGCRVDVVESINRY